MRHHTHHGFTRREALALVVVVVVISGWVVSLLQNPSPARGRIRVQAEIRNLAMACEMYKTEHGHYPRSEGVTEMTQGGETPITPLRDGNPTSDSYKKASAFLYVALTGDKNMDGQLTPPDEPSEGYMDFHTNSRMLAGNKDQHGKLTKVLYLQDPYGNSYGYSTAGARQEEDFQAERKKSGSKERPVTELVGFNPTFDLWSTGGKIIKGAVSDSDRMAWFSNW